MNYLLDTNILVRLANKQCPLAPMAESAIEQLMRDGHLLFTCPQVIEEFYVVATRPSDSRGGLGMVPLKAREHILDFQQSIILLDQKPVYETWFRLIDVYSISGLQAHDTRIAAFMLEHGINYILTFNDKHFARYAPEGIVAITPESATH